LKPRIQAKNDFCSVYCSVYRRLLPSQNVYVVEPERHSEDLDLMGIVRAQSEAGPQFKAWISFPEHTHLASPLFKNRKGNLQ
jgi:hypothetical protein